MENTNIDGGKLFIALPGGFAILTPAELQALYGMDYDGMWGARDEARHMLVTVIWKDSGGLATKLADEKSLAKRVEKALSKTYRRLGYRCDGLLETRIAGREAHGFRYSYQPEGISQSCEVVVFKDGKRCYTLYYYTRLEVALENRPIYDSLLASLVL